MPKAYSSAGTFTRRIGSTNYRVVVHYCPDENENFESKVTRMIRNDLAFFDSESENVPFVAVASHCGHFSCCGAQTPGP